VVRGSTLDRRVPDDRDAARAGQEPDDVGDLGRGHHPPGQSTIHATEPVRAAWWGSRLIRVLRSRGRVAEGETNARHTSNDDTTGSGRVAEGETHARHTGNDD
jgi:hypothetical protein